MSKTSDLSLALDFGLVLATKVALRLILVRIKMLGHKMGRTPSIYQIKHHKKNVIRREIWTGPITIVSKHSPVSYLVRHAVTPGPVGKINVADLKPW